MTSLLFKEILISLSVLSVLLIFGTFLRAKIKIFQKLFLPASVIGGFIGLFLGPEVLGKISGLELFGNSIPKIWSLLPGTLIIPVFAAIPLGLFLNAKGKATQLTDEGKKTQKKNRYAQSALICFGIFMGVSWLQSATGLFTTVIFNKFWPETGLYRVFGWELSQGFAGGHGSAGGIASLYQQLGFDFWETAQGVSIATATVGLVCGMISGIIMINIAARKGETAIMQKPSELSPDILLGLVKNSDNQQSLGRETTKNSTIETFSLHLALILIACGGAYFIVGLLSKLGISLPVWIGAMIVMFGINGIIKVFKMDWLIDKKVVSRISGTLTDIAVTAAIASMPLTLINKFLAPLIVMCVLGLLLSYLYIFKMTKWLMKDNYPFEHSIISWGSATGVMITGVMLLKICDPEYKTPVLQNFSTGFSLLSLTGVVQYLFIPYVLQNFSSMSLTLLFLAISVLFSIVAIVASFSHRKVKA